VAVHFAGEHALEFQPPDGIPQRRHVRCDCLQGLFIGLRPGQFEQLRGLAQAGADAFQPPDRVLQVGALAPQALGTGRIVPDPGLFELPQDLGQALALPLVVKDTP